MEFKTLMVIILVVIFIVALVLFPEFRTLIKGFFRLFVKDLATTPEGAEAIYGEKINKAQEAYSKADDIFKKLSGRLSNAKRSLDQNKSRLVKIESECEVFVKNGKMDMAELKAEEREDVVGEISRLTELVNNLTDAVANAKEAFEMCEKNLRKLKRDKTQIVENMRLKSQLKETWDDVDELKSVSGADKLLEEIKTKNNDLDAMVEGAKVVHNSKLSSRLEKADKEAARLQSNDYLSNLKKKYHK